METKVHVTGNFASVEEQASEVSTWGARYSGLIERLAELGSEVRVIRIVETDQDSPPGRFYRGAMHQFVFPPQPVTVSEDNSHVIDPTPGYELHQEDITRTYDPALVTGHLEVRYGDADSRVAFSVADRLSQSVLTDELLAALNDSGLM